MKKSSKYIALLILTSMLAAFFTGCSTDEMALFNAISKSNTIKSQESKTDLTFSLDASGLKDADKQSFQTAAQLLNGLKITLNQKTNLNDAKTISKSQIDASIQTESLAVNTSMWVNYDFASTKPTFKEIIKLPMEFTSFMPPQLSGKEYLVMDLMEMMNEQPDSNVDFGNLMNSYKNIIPKMTDFLKTYALQFNPGFDIATRKSNKVISGENMSVYELRLNDSSFKALLKYSINNFLQNEDAMKFLEEYLYSIMDAMESSNPNAATSKEDISKAFDELKDNLPELLGNINQFLDTFNNVKLLGDNGIVIDYTINSAGYIVNQSGAIDIKIDAGALTKAFAKTYGADAVSESAPSSESAVYNIGIKFNTDTYNINKTVDIKIPETNENNSVKYSDLIKPQALPDIKDDSYAPKTANGSIAVYVNDAPLDMDVAPELVGGRLLVPTRAIFEELGADVSWDASTGTIRGLKDGTEIVLKVDSKYATINTVPKTLDVPVTIINGRSFVPLRFISEGFGASVEWDAATRSVSIIER